MSAAPGGAGRPSWVIVPALNEADLIERCLAALAVAARRAPGPVQVIVVDDGSTDATAAHARRALQAWPGEHSVLRGHAAGVGWARRLGFEHALTRLGQRAGLIATTDADSCVAADWLAVLHRHLDHGREVIAGDVVLDARADDGPAAARAKRLALRLTQLPSAEAGGAHAHFAGSNLGFSAEALRALGPLPAPRTLEDQALLFRCRELGIAVHRCAAARVTTSSRTDGRAPGGLADALAADARSLASSH